MATYKQMLRALGGIDEAIRWKKKRERTKVRHF